VSETLQESNAAPESEEALESAEAPESEETLESAEAADSDEASDDEASESEEALESAEAESEEDTAGEPARSAEDMLVQEGDIAGDYLEQLLDLLDYDGDIDLDVEASRAVVSIEGGEDLEKLVGPRGTVLEALQELTRLSVQQETGVRSRLMLDIAGWRAGRRNELKELGRSAAEQAVRTGESVKLQAMTPFERKVVHDAVAEVKGAHSESEGEEPRRRVVVSVGD
jgi:spoIIIJ-associated protein